VVRWQKLSRLFHTIRYLRPVQIYGRIWFRLYSPSVDLSPAPLSRLPSGESFLPVRREQSLLSPRLFRFINQEHELVNADDWDNPKLSKLWRYNLHYFDDLTAADAEARSSWHQDLMLRWVQENPPGRGTGWEPYPTSLRIVNWVKWDLAGNLLPSECRQSLSSQARWLSRRLEYHLLGNHLLANAKALVFAGLFFEGLEAEGWLTTGMKLLKRELQEQILADAGHFERSPMYHAIVLADLLDLAQIALIYPDVLPPEDVESWRETIPRMLHWLAVMTHPDEEIALFNDAAFGIAPCLSDLEAGATALCIAFDTSPKAAVNELTESGYVRLQKGPAVLIADVGNIGPDYLPGHAHADSLSFEMSLYEQRVIVDTGTSCYDMTDERLFERGTLAHNTVQVNGEDSSEVWGSFRVARRARPSDYSIRQEHGAVTVSCAHDGYTRLSGRPVHRRKWSLDEKKLLVRDSIEGNFTEAVARFHFHPDVVVVEGSEPETGSLQLPGGEELQWQVQGGRQIVVAGTYHPEFGLSLPNRCLEIVLKGNCSEVEFRWN